MSRRKRQRVPATSSVSWTREQLRWTGDVLLENDDAIIARLDRGKGSGHKVVIWLDTDVTFDEVERILNGLVAEARG